MIVYGIAWLIFALNANKDTDPLGPQDLGKFRVSIHDYIVFNHRTFF